ncbi:MAG: BglII/BstYI family type II restriction endonuclease [Hyphomicrobiaceae bacterium]
MASDETEEQDDVAATPSAGSDSSTEVARWIPQDLRNLYEVHSYRHAASILLNSHEREFQDIAEALRNFRLTTEDIKMGGGNESGIVKRVSALLRPRGWHETRISADLKVTKETTKKVDRETKQGVTKTESIKERQFVDIPNFVDGHKVDYVKQRIAFDMEWNSKDQTFDRDLYAFRAFYDCSLISAGILLTRSASLNPIFSSLGVKTKYGASTTWMGKLLYRLNAGRNGGCPVLVFGIGDKLVTDWESKL